MTDDATTGPDLAGHADERCPICAATGRHRRADGGECDHCGLVLLDGCVHADVRRAVREWLVDGQQAQGWRLSDHAVRNAAWALALDRDGSAWIPARRVPHQVTLAVMARPGDAATVAAMVAALAFPRAVVLLDADPAYCSPVRFPRGTRVAAHPLAADYAAQRNRMQALALPGWVLHLDSDELPGPALRASLGWLTNAADRDGLEALGLPRRNLVDGALSALYPDIQYRLVRDHVRFAGIVHERPAVAFERTSLALAGAIEHRLSRDRVVERTRLYGAMAFTGARPEDEAALLSPYRGLPVAAA